MRGSEFVFDYAHLLCYESNKTSFNRCGLYMDSSNRIKNKNATNLINKKDNKCFQYVVTAKLN